ncbi:hypothetical protein N320_11776, partial [Buceros rhinoceros silvestris]
EGSVQVLELQAVRIALELCPGPVNIVTDSKYVASLLPRLHRSLLKHVDNQLLFQQLTSLWHLLNARKAPFFIMHFSSHTSIPGFLTKGNAAADALVSSAQVDTYAQAKASHGFFHQSAHALQRQFQLNHQEAKDIIAMCPHCARIPMLQAQGTNPRGLCANALWQTDTTEYAPFGRLRFIHVSTDTFSHAIWATLHTTTNARHTIAHWLSAFLSEPLSLKTDNGPAYRSQSVHSFCKTWAISHSFGVPYNSTGQSIIEHSHLTLKRYL